MGHTLSYCGQVVRDYDPDRFLLSMFAPADLQENLWALFAFNHEIAKTREVVSETQLGLIRLQWWREHIGKIYEGDFVEGHEILSALADTIRKHDLPRDEFDQLIYAREFDLEDVLPSDIQGFLNYADYTTSPLNALASRICGGEPHMEPLQAVSINYALTGLLRAVVAHARQRRCYLPQDLLTQHNVRVEGGLYELKPGEGMRAVAGQIVEHFVPGIKPAGRFLKASQVLSEIYAKQIKGVKCDLFSPNLAVDPPFKVLRLYFALNFL